MISTLYETDSLRILKNFTCIGVWIALLLATCPVGAAVYPVTKPDDTADGACDADCSLREAILAANATAEADEVQVPAGEYTLSRTGKNEDAAATGDLDISQPITIVGAEAATTRVMGDGDRIFDILTTAQTVTLRRLTLSNGLTGTLGTTASVSEYGGAITTGAALSIEECVFADNRAVGSLTKGGAIYAAASLSISHATFSTNYSQSSGGAIYMIGNDSQLEIAASTFYQNDAYQGPGGALYLGTGVNAALANSTFSKNSGAYSGAIQISSAETVSFTQLTITENTATESGGIFVYNTPVTLTNTIITHNTATMSPDCTGIVTSLGYNLMGDTTNCTITATTGDQFNVATAVLAEYQDTGAPGGGHHPLTDGSTAINQGSDAACLRPDQLGRPQVSTCDIGAIEVQLCGNGTLNEDETCDDGNDDNTDACLITCQVASCGDGVIQTGVESCDDSNILDGDGCSALCQIEQIEEIFSDDADADGYPSSSDCDDSNPSIYLNAPEICGDGIDQDCNGDDTICTPLQEETPITEEQPETPETPPIEEPPPTSTSSSSAGGCQLVGIN